MMGTHSTESHTRQDVDLETKNGLIATGNADAALEFLRSEDIAVITEVDEKALVRKIDWMIMPLMWAAYNLQYLDKVLSRFRFDRTPPLFSNHRVSQLCLCHGPAQRHKHAH
jgi:hypothetical protein